MLFQFLTFAYMDPYSSTINRIQWNYLLFGQMVYLQVKCWCRWILCLPTVLSVPPDCEPHWRDWTLSHHKHYFWLRPLFLGQKYSEKTPELPGNLWTVLRLWAAGCWISVSTQTFDFSFFFFFFSWINSDFWCNAKSPLWLGPVAACPACQLEWAPWMKRWPCYRHQSRVLRGWALSIRRSPRKPWKRHLIYRKEVGSGNLVALNECAYCYHVCFLISCSLWQMHGQHCLTTL